MATMITRTIESSVLTVVGISPSTFDKVEKKVTIVGKYSDMSTKEKEKVKSNLTTNDFVPALIVDKGEYEESVYEISIEDFMRYAKKVEKKQG